MLFSEEPEWMQKARQAPLHTNWEDRLKPAERGEEEPIRATPHKGDH